VTVHRDRVGLRLTESALAELIDSSIMTYFGAPGCSEPADRT
jgi:hypothetical protein